MINIIANTKPQAGYVLEEENETYLVLIHYEKSGKLTTPDVLDIYEKEQFLDIQDKSCVQDVFEDFVKPSDVLYVREEVVPFIPALR